MAVAPDALAQVLARETAHSYAVALRAVQLLRPLGWGDHHIRRAFGIMAQSGLSLQSLIEAARISSGSIDETLDALTPRRDS